MTCAVCRDVFDPQRQSAVCPHLGLASPGLPTGGPRITAEQRATIDEAFHVRDSDTLWRLMGHNNPAVRVYAGQMYDAIEAMQRKDLGLTPK
jgi:hypothetical protein